MAVSSTVFAPTVRMVQPAFIYTKAGGIDIYFSLSSYNTLNDIYTGAGGIKYSIIDPNQKSVWGNNSMFSNGAEFQSAQLSSSSHREYGEYYFRIPCSILKDLTVNQYYQVQFSLREKSKDIFSAPSQATLIRPIEAPKLIVDINGKTVASSELSTIGGYIYDPNGSNVAETLTRYQLDFSTEGKQVFSTGIINNDLGVQFSWKSTYNFEEGKTYSMTFTGWTVNGYKIPNSTVSFTVKGYNAVAAWDQYQAVSSSDTFDQNGVYYVEKSGVYHRVYLTRGFEVGVQYYKSSLVSQLYSDMEKGAVAIQLTIPDSLQSSNKILIQRSDEFSNFNSWNTVASIDCSNIIGVGSNFLIYDYQAIGDHTFYKYRFILNNGSNPTKISKLDYLIENISNSDVYLSHQNKQLVLRYNTNISGLKWVVQENIANTLGGKYPIIRRNAHTKYRQFQLSGTMYFDPSALEIDGVDSRQNSMSKWFTRDDDTLFLSVNDAFGKDNLNIFSWEDRDGASRTAIYEKRFKDAAMQFLTDGNPKLFRTPEEGSLIVVLTNISFTPNIKLNRRVYDFSATVTEVADATLENLIKYDLMRDPTHWKYILNAQSVVINPTTYVVTPYVGESELIEREGIVYLVLTEV